MAASSDPYPWQEPVSKPARGAFIVIEGLDRAGKTTQVKRLCDKLYAQGHNIKAIRFPGIYQFPYVTIPFLDIFRLDIC
jgi:dTMP kinase